MIRSFTTWTLVCLLTFSESLTAQQQPTAPAQSQPAATSEPPRVSLPNPLMDGTAVKVRLAETISSADAKTGQQDRIPFRELMQTAGAEPSVPPIGDAKDQSAAVTTQPHARHMTTGGKIMTGVGIGMLVIGGLVLVGTATVGEHSWASSSDKAKLYGAGGGIVAGGSILIVLGNHRRAAR